MSSHSTPKTIALLVVVVSVLSTTCMVECQFLQPQSHLSRLMQSITSPLVLSGALGAQSMAGDSSSDDDGRASLADVAGASLPMGGSPGGANDETRSTSNSLPLAQQQHYYQQQRQHQQQAAISMQQAAAMPSHQRQYPAQRHNHYRGGSDADGASDDDEASSAEPSSQTGNNRHRGRHTGTASSHADHQLDERPSAPQTEHYKMGAYLGPTMDDKEIQGAFNSAGDERDDDEVNSLGNDDTGNSATPLRHAASHAYSAADSGAGPSAADSYGASMNSNKMVGAGRRPAGSSDAGRGGAAYDGYDDESGADEDDGSYKESPRRRSPVGQPERQHNKGGPQSGSPSQLMAAANGYAPYGYANGPIDLSALMGGGGGGQGYEVYNGDGSYPGMYGQQQGRGNGRRKQSASAMNPYSNYGPYGGGPYGAVGANNNGYNNDRDNDDQDNDGDDD